MWILSNWVNFNMMHTRTTTFERNVRFHWKISTGSKWGKLWTSDFVWEGRQFENLLSCNHMPILIGKRIQSYKPGAQISETREFFQGEWLWPNWRTDSTCPDRFLNLWINHGNMLLSFPVIDLACLFPWPIHIIICCMCQG